MMRLSRSPSDREIDWREKQYFVELFDSRGDPVTMSNGVTKLMVPRELWEEILNYQEVTVVDR